MATLLFRRKIKRMARAAVNGGSFSNQRRPRESDVADLGGLGSDAQSSPAAHQCWCDQTSATRLLRLKRRRFAWVPDAGDLLARIRLPERELGPPVRDRVTGRGAKVVHELVRKPLVDNEQRKASGFRHPNRRQEPNHVRRRAPAPAGLPAWRHQCGRGSGNPHLARFHGQPGR